MMEKGGDMAGPSANNSSDFVRKLYKMLEDPSYESIVRWGEGGESFVVLENEKFTKQILPKHFKHSNFASFVRQLNKYDFHKVRQNNEDNTQSPYGQNAWEFKHPEFQANKKDSLDNIRRKAPAPRKTAQTTEETYPAHAQQQVELLNTQLMATQQQLQGLSRNYQELAGLNVMLLQQVVDCQKFIKNHDGVMRSMFGYLFNQDAQRRNGRAGGLSNGTAPNMLGRATDDNHPSTPLLQAQNLLGQLSAENYPSKELEQMSHEHHIRTDYSTPPNDPGGLISMPPISDSLNAPAGYSMDKSELDLVYPVGAINGIDPIDEQHANNIPYALPPSGLMPRDSMPPADLMPQPPRTSGPRKKGSVSIWGEQKPRILLVEDDQVCARIGTKFLESFECGVDIARDGLEAVSKINLGAENHFDLILMDIIMPHLDGVSATVCIREMRANLPIIAMTSNIRTDDIEMYFRYGMNDVLPKPFTKEGMMRALEKHLGHFRKKAPALGYSSPRQMSHTGGFVTPSQSHTPLGLSMGQLTATQPIVDDVSSGKSPQTATSWQSPVQLPGGSPVVTSAPGSYMQSTMQPNANGMREPSYSVTPTHPHPQSGFPPPLSTLNNQRPPHRRGISDMSGSSTQDGNHEQKRQRMYAQPGNFQQ